MLDMGCCCCTPQEQWIEDAAKGKPSPFRAEQPRVIDMLESFDCTPPVIDVERARYFTESMRETEGQHLTLRWAKALMNVAQKMPVYIEDTQLIVGRLGRDNCRYGILYPELDGDFYKSVLDDFATRENPPIRVMDEDIDVIVNEIGAYWNGKTYHHELFKRMPERCKRMAYGDKEGLQPRYVVAESSSLRSSLQWVLDFDKVLKLGFKGVKENARRRLEALDQKDPYNIVNRIPFLEAVMLTCDAVVVWARRHAELAREKAAVEKDPARRQELLEIAERCEWVPENPARTFHEAVQAHWFAQAFSRLEQRTGCIISNGRMDQQLISYYRKDMESGVLTEKKALEILGCMWCQMAQFIELPLSPGVMDTQAGFAHWEAVTIGGQTPDGQDATNELSYLILRSKREVPLNYPDLAARVHAMSPERFLMEVAETIKEGSGFPKIFNDEEIIPLYLEKGVPIPVANDWAASGCTEVRLPNWDTCLTPHPWLNLGSVLEMTLNNGRLHYFNNELYGLETGDARNFTSFEQFFEAFKAQTFNMLKHAYILVMCVEKVRAANLATPLFSMLHDKAFEQCIDLHSNNVKGGVSIGFFDLIGLGTVLDSFAAIKKLVFDEKKLTMARICDAVDANFEGYDDILQMVKACPKYGNNDPYVDQMGYELEKAVTEFAHKHRTGNNTELDVRYVPVTSHIPLGKVVWATPNGRLAGTYLSEGSSASHGADIHGPTAVLLSNAHSKYSGLPERASRLLNIKLSPNTVAGREGSRKLVAFIRTFCALKLWHMQFNVIHKETLYKAQEHPKEFKNLLVRVAGYSAYFVDLSPGLQNEIIARVEHTTF